MTRHKIQYLRLLVLLFIALFLLSSQQAKADLSDADQAEEKARNSFVDHFIKFVQDKNVMGRATRPDGKDASGGAKVQFNQDDGASYRSDLTYHDNSFNTDDEVFEQKNKNSTDPKQDKKRTLPLFVSSHGGIAEGGGSSALERAVYSQHEKLLKDDEDPKNQKKPPQEGIRNESVFQIETREVKAKDLGAQNQAAQNGAGGTAGTQKPPGGAGQAGNTNAQDPNQAKENEEDKVIEVSRRVLREPVKKEVEKVGTDSYQSIDAAAKDPESANDPDALANSTLLYAAAGRAIESWWNSTIANLGQRRAQKQVRAGSTGFRPELSESLASCEEWAKKAREQIKNELAKQGGTPNPNRVKQLEEGVKEGEDKCRAMAQTPYYEVNPEFKVSDDGKTEELKTGDFKTEDGVSRDLRNQLEVLNSAGRDVSKLQSNWKYEANEDKQDVVIGFGEDGGGNPETVKMSVKEQLDSYNQQLKEAGQNLDEVKKRFPDLQLDRKEIEQYAIQPESQSVMDIVRNTPSQLEELGIAKDNGFQAPQNYEQVVQQSQAAPPKK